MQGSSRGAFAQARQALETVMTDGVDGRRLADELFALLELLDDNGPLRRALADPSRDGEQKTALVRRLFAERLAGPAASVLTAAASQRWHRDRDLTDALEQLAVEVLLRGAARDGSIAAVEDELFRFGRIVAGEPELRAALTDRRADADAKGRLVDRLVAGKVRPVTAELLHRAAAAPRGRRFDHVIEEQLAVAARMQEQLTAVVTAAQPLTAPQRERLTAALRQQYDKAVQLNVVVDPQVLGGLKVEVEDEVIDGTVQAKLDDARRRLAG